MFGIAGGWKATALEADVWLETAVESRRGLMVAWRKEEVDVARYHQEKREATRLGKLSYTEEYEQRSDTSWSSRREKGILYGHETDGDQGSA